MPTKPKKFIRKKKPASIRRGRTSRKTEVRVKTEKEQTVKQAKEQESPKNSRSITESLVKFQFPTIRFNLRIGLHAINILALLGLLLVGIGLGRYIEQAEKLQEQKNALEVKLSHWETLAQRYTGFRDLYVNIAIVAYEVKDFKTSMEYVEKALEIDPNFLPALKLKGELLTR